MAVCGRKRMRAEIKYTVLIEGLGPQAAPLRMRSVLPRLQPECKVSNRRRPLNEVTISLFVINPDSSTLPDCPHSRFLTLPPPQLVEILMTEELLESAAQWKEAGKPRLR